MKKIGIGVMMLGIIFSGTHISYGKQISIPYAETDQQLLQAEEILNKSGYKDIQTSQSVDDIVKVLQQRGDPINSEFLALTQEIETYKKTHPVADIKTVVKHFNKKAGLKEKTALDITLIHRAQALSYYEWSQLSTAEKLLVASNPAYALITNSVTTKAFNYTHEKFGYNGLGDRSDGYRHGVWSALLTRDTSRLWAELYGNAHEDRPLSELNSRQSDGYYGYQHKSMDLTNNKVGRDSIAWYEYFFNCSDTTIKNRISVKLTNTAGNIVWLHN